MMRPLLRSLSDGSVVSWRIPGPAGDSSAVGDQLEFVQQIQELGLGVPYFNTFWGPVS